MKAIRLQPISKADADACVRRWHYSGRSVPNSQVNLGAFLHGQLLGALQFGPPMDRSKVLGLVRGSEWQHVIELNRLAFSDQLPRNSESRCLAVALRMFRAKAPQVKWCLSFADGAQCGDGAIYRAAGFLLTQVRENHCIWRFPNGALLADVTMRAHWDSQRVAEVCVALGVPQKHRSVPEWRTLGATPLAGFMLRYVKFLDPQWVDRLVPKPIPYSEIPAEVRMYRGQRAAASSEDPGHQPGQGGAAPTPPLQSAQVG